jgi:hypothetical protein
MALRKCRSGEPATGQKQVTIALKHKTAGDGDEVVKFNFVQKLNKKMNTELPRNSYYL